MRKLDRRDFLKIMGLGAGAAAIPALIPGQAFSSNKPPAGFYDLPMKGNVRLLHITDVHGQLKPVYFREPNVNLGVAEAYGRPPHLVGNKLLKAMGLKPNTPESYAYSYLNFEHDAAHYGKTGGFAHLKTLLDGLRNQAGGKNNTLTIDGGDLWQDTHRRKESPL